MGSGKSTVGKRLASALDYLFVDTDREIERLSGKAIPEIFNEEGESTFRNQETKFLGFIKELDKVIISTGGGLPIFNDNLISLLESGLTIYIDCDASTLVERITNDPSDRPLHKNLKSKTELISATEKRLAERYPIYREAHYVVNGNQKIDTVVNEILTSLQGAN